MQPHHRPACRQPHLKLSNVRVGREDARLATATAAEWQPFGGTLDELEVMQYSPVQSIWRATLRTPVGLAGQASGQGRGSASSAKGRAFGLPP